MVQKLTTKFKIVKLNDDLCDTENNPSYKQQTTASKTILSELYLYETNIILINEQDKSEPLEILSSSNNVSEVTTEPIVNFIGDDYDAISEVFVAPSPNSTTQIKLHFLDQHPIHPNRSIYELPFQASRVYYRNIELGDKFLRKWLSYNVKNKKFYCNICMTFSLDRDSVWIHGATYTVKRIYDKIKNHEENCQSHEFAVQTLSQIKFKDKGDILNLLDSSRKKIVSNNREIVSRVVDIIIFLAKQNLSFRGKRNENV